MHRIICENGVYNKIYVIKAAICSCDKAKVLEKAKMFGKSGSIVIRSLIGCQRRSFGYRFQNGLPICCERPEYRCINETSQRRYSKLTGDNTRSYKGLIAAVTVGSFGLGKVVASNAYMAIIWRYEVVCLLK